MSIYRMSPFSVTHHTTIIYSISPWISSLCFVFLDHINGKKHLRALGFSMRVEKSNVSQVSDRINALKRKMEDAKKPRPSAMADYESRIAKQLADEELRKRQKKEAEQRKKQEQLEAAEEEVIDPEIAALMGFGGFGGSKKK